MYRHIQGQSCVTHAALPQVLSTQLAAQDVGYLGAHAKPCHFLPRFHMCSQTRSGMLRYTPRVLQVLMTQLAAKDEGYNDVVYLDAKTDTFLEEVSSCNIFTVSGRTIRTPPLQARLSPV